MKKSSSKNLDKFLNEINNLTNEIGKLKKFEVDIQNIEGGLKVSEFKSLSWIENSPVCTKIIDLDFNLKYMSKSGVEKLKIDNITEFYGKPYPLSFYSDSFKIPMQKCLDDVKKTKESITQEASILDRDGNEIWFQSTIIPINNEYEELDYFMVVSLDTTKRKQAEQAILKSKSFNESLLKTSPDIIYVYDLIEHKNIYSNNGNMKVLGYSMQDILDFGNTFLSQLMHPEDFDHYKNITLKQYENAKDGDIIEMVFRAKHKNGGWRWLHSRESIFKRNKEGKVTQVIGIAGDITDHKNALEKLKATQEQLKNTFDLSPSIIGLADIKKGYFLEVNAAVTRILGYSVEEFTSVPYLELIHPDDRPKTSTAVAEKLKGNKTASFENRYRCKDGSYKWIAWQGTERDNEGLVTAIGSDITESVLNKKSKLDELNRVISSSPSCLKIITREGILLDMNRRGLDILAIDELSDIKGDSIYDVIDDQHKEDFIAFNERICNGESGTLEFIINNSKGEKVWVETYARPYKLSNGKVAHIAITNDITERINNEKILKENQELLNITGEIAKVGGWELNLITRQLKWSEETKRVHEVEENYIPNLDTALDFYHPDDREKVQNSLNAAIETNEQFNFEARIITAKGNEKYVRSKGLPVCENGECIRIYGAFQDITEQKKIELELENYRKELEIENVQLKKEISLSFNYENMVYSSSKMSDVLTKVEQVAQTNATVLILGETGTGKELIAKAIHNTSKRKNNSLIRVNCATIPSELIESELFGHVKGSFTGAIDNRIGKFELADGGTIFLDEIGELPLALQPKLLRVIQEGEIEPIGSSQLRKLDVRIIAATNKNLKKEIEEKRFREDLYFRLNVFPIHVPPLKERSEDIPVLIEYFVNKYCKKHGKQIKYISDGTLSQMKDYSWPGNVRELENLVERAIIISDQDLLLIQEFNDNPINKTNIQNYTATLAEVQRDHIIKILNQTNWKIDGKEGAAKLLDLKPSTLRDRMKKLGIRRL